MSQYEATERGYQWRGKSIDIVGQPAFTQLLAFSVPGDATDGVFMVTGNIAEDAAKVDNNVSGYGYSAGDVRVVGLVGSERLVVASTALGMRRQSWSYAFAQGGDGRRWEQIILEARFILDGTVGSLMRTGFGVLYPTTCPIVMQLTAMAILNRGGR